MDYDVALRIFQQYIAAHHEELYEHDSQVVVDKQGGITVFDTLGEAYPFLAGRGDLYCFRYDGLNPPSIKFRRNVTVGFGGKGVHPYSAIAPVVLTYIDEETKEEKTVNDIRMTIDTGSIDSLEPGAFLKSLKLTALRRAQDSEMADGSARSSSFVLLKIAHRDDPKVQIPIQIDYFIKKRDNGQEEEEKYTKKEVEQAKLNPDEWLMGMDFLRLFKHTWINCTEVKFSLLSEYKLMDGTFTSVSAKDSPKKSKTAARRRKKNEMEQEEQSRESGKKRMKQ